MDFLSNSLDNSFNSNKDNDEELELLNMIMLISLTKYSKSFIDRLHCKTIVFIGKEYIRDILWKISFSVMELFRMKSYVFLNCVIG